MFGASMQVLWDQLQLNGSWIIWQLYKPCIAGKCLKGFFLKRTSQGTMMYRWVSCRPLHVNACWSDPDLIAKEEKEVLQRTFQYRFASKELGEVIAIETRLSDRPHICSTFLSLWSQLVATLLLVVARMTSLRHFFLTLQGLPLSAFRLPQVAAVPVFITTFWTVDFVLGLSSLCFFLRAGFSWLLPEINDNRKINIYLVLFCFSLQPLVFKCFSLSHRFSLFSSFPLLHHFPIPSQTPPVSLLTLPSAIQTFSFSSLKTKWEHTSLSAWFCSHFYVSCFSTAYFLQHFACLGYHFFRTYTGLNWYLHRSKYSIIDSFLEAKKANTNSMGKAQTVTDELLFLPAKLWESLL